MSLRTIGLMALGLFVLSCGKDPGSFEIRFTWVDEKPVEGTVWIHARVEHRPNGRDVAGDGVGGAPPVLWYSGSQLDISAVPNGTNRVVVVEIREGEDKDSTLLYFGLSEPFTLEPGKHVEVQVALALQRTPGFEGGTSLLVLNAIDGRVSTPALRLRLTARDSDEIHIAQNPGFTYAARELPAAPLEVSSTATSAVYELDYDLNEGLDCAGGECVDSTRQLFARVVNDQGYRSDVISTRVVLDSSAPAVEAVSFSPHSASLFTRVQLAVLMTEELDPDPSFVPELTFSPAGPDFTFERIDGRSYLFTTEITSALPNGTYRVATISARDLAKNEAVLTVSPDFPALEVDSQPPSISLVSVEPQILGRNGTATVTLELAEELAEGTVVTLGGEQMSCQQQGGEMVCLWTEMGTLPAGTHAIVATVADLAGNQSLVDSSIILDFTAPDIRSLTVGPIRARSGSRIFLELVTDEPLGDVDPVPAFTGPGEAQFTILGINPTRSSFTYVFDVADTTAEGMYTLSAITLADPYGNSAARTPAVAAIFEVDRSAPTIGNLTITSTRAQPVAPDRFASGDEFSIGFTLDGAESADVSVGGVAAVCSPAQPGVNSCTFTVAAGIIPAGTEATEPVVVRARDGAGNESSASTSVIVDFLSPSLIVNSESVALIPSAGNLLGDDITAIGVGSSARFQFSVSEALSTDPIVLARAGVTDQPMTNAGQVGLTYLYGHTVAAAGGQQGAHSISVVLRDQAGNTSTVAASLGFEVDTVDPRGAETVIPGVVLFTRIPWGRPQGATGPYFSVVGNAGAVDGDVTVRVLHPFSGEVARAQAAADGSFDLQALPMTDTAGPSVQAIDGAGNASPINPIRSGRWIGSLRGKTANSSATNPHRVAGIFEVSRSLDQTDQELTTPEYQTIAGGAGLFTVTARQRWQDLAVGLANPGPRSLAATAYDPIRGRVIMFGGFFNVDLGSTWEWDGTQWTDVTPLTVSPSARRRSAMAFDVRRGVAVLFGGRSGGVVLDDTWEWDGRSWTQINVPGPLAREGHSMVYDSERGAIVLHAGAIFTGFQSNETWEYNGTWVPLQPACAPAPCTVPGDEAIAMVYDEANRRTVRYGGTRAFGGDRDTWTYDGETWTQHFAGPVGPTPRLGTQMAYDRARQRVVLFGGLQISPAFGVVNDAWLWDGSTNTWSVEPSPARPLPRFDHAMAYSDVTGETLVYGGQLNGFGGPYTGDAATNDGLRWRPASQTSAPVVRNGAVMAPMPGGAGVFLFGGEPFLGSVNKLSDVWRFDGRAWVALSVPGLLPRAGAAASYDTARDRILIFGGETNNYISTNSLEAYDGNSWSSVFLGGPAPRLQHGMAYDPVRDRLVVFGGLINNGLNESNDTWVYDPTANSWTQVPAPPAALTPRAGSAMAYDPAINEILMFGGYLGNATFQETWSFNATTMQWTQLNPGTTPARRARSQMVFDPDRNRVVMFGGTPLSGGAILDDTWEWNGATWSEVLPTSRPPPREYHSLTYGGSPGSVFTFGGLGNGSDVWRKQIPTLIRPGVKLSFDWGAAQVPTTAVGSVQVSVLAGATGGVELNHWDPLYGRWSALAASTAAAGAPAPLAATLVGANGQEAIAGDGSLNFMLQSAADLGTAVAAPAVVADDVEVTIDYRLP